jgi:hypothetical protein
MVVKVVARKLVARDVSGEASLRAPSARVSLLLALNWSALPRSDVPTFSLATNLPPFHCVTLVGTIPHRFFCHAER